MTRILIVFPLTLYSLWEESSFDGRSYGEQLIQNICIWSHRHWDWKSWHPRTRYSESIWPFHWHWTLSRRWTKCYPYSCTELVLIRLQLSLFLLHWVLRKFANMSCLRCYLWQEFLGLWSIGMPYENFCHKWESRLQSCFCRRPFHSSNWPTTGCWKCRRFPNRAIGRREDCCVRRTANTIWIGKSRMSLGLWSPRVSSVPGMSYDLSIIVIWAATAALNTNGTVLLLEEYLSNVSLSSWKVQNKMFYFKTNNFKIP